MKIETVIDYANNISYIIECETEIEKSLLSLFKQEAKKNFIILGKDKEEKKLHFGYTEIIPQMKLSEYVNNNDVRMSNRLKNYLNRHLLEHKNLGDFYVNKNLLKTLKKFKYFGLRRERELEALLVEDKIIKKSLIFS